MQAVNFYSVSNVETCSPYAGFQVGGGWISIDKRISTRMNSKNYNTYQTIYYPRYLLDEAYYSMDVCHWKGVGIEYRFIKNSVLYSFSIKDSDITQVRQVIIQCESLNKNRTDGISQTCKSHEPNEFSMIDSYSKLRLTQSNLNDERFINLITQIFLAIMCSTPYGYLSISPEKNPPKRVF